MRLSELHPVMLERGHLEFDCPAGHPHRIVIPIDSATVPNAWIRSGAFPDTLTLHPSILPRRATPTDDTLTGEAYDEAAKCGWHGFITNGDVTTC